MTLCAIAAAVLTACGGGDGSSGASHAGTATLLASADATPAAGSSDSVTTTDAGPDTSALALKPTANQIVTIASESQNFLVAGTMTVRYGAGSDWVSKQVTDTGSCSNDYFGKDPKYGTVKSCQVVVGSTTTSTTDTIKLATLAPTAALPTTENGTFYVFGTGSVRYGANGKWITKSVTGRATCSNGFFGNDPIYGTVKSCQALKADGTPIETVVAAVVPAATASAATPAAAAASAPATTIVAPVVPAGSLLPVVNLSKIPAPGLSYTDFRVGPANLANPVNVPAVSDIGDVRLHCEFSHFSYADPIVYPGKPGAHLHVFMGNSGVDTNSTAESIRNTGGSSCDGGTANRTAYWMPAIIDTRDGSAVKPNDALIYYKQGYDGILGPDIKPFPVGLRMVAGDPNNSQRGQERANWGCTKPDGSNFGDAGIPADCPAGSTLSAVVVFPQCWDGVNLDSPDHRSHMADVSGGKCPSTHPVPVTNITMKFNYVVPDSNATKYWRLSSDNYDTGTRGGLSIHADWLNGWNPDVLNTWVTQCINKTLNCWVDVLGDGRILY